MAKCGVSRCVGRRRKKLACLLHIRACALLNLAAISRGTIAFVVLTRDPLLVFINASPSINLLDKMDHLPFWHWGPTGAGSGLGCGTSEIIDYVGTLNPSQFTGPYNHMVQKGTFKNATAEKRHSTGHILTNDNVR